MKRREYTEKYVITILGIFTILMIAVGGIISYYSDNLFLSPGSCERVECYAPKDNVIECKVTKYIGKSAGRLLNSNCGTYASCGEGDKRPLAVLCKGDRVNCAAKRAYNLFCG